MKKDAIIECVLDMWLTQNQLAIIQEKFPAFYENPVKFRGHALADIVKKYLAGEYPD